MKLSLLLAPAALAYVLLGAHVLFHGFGLAALLAVVPIALLFAPNRGVWRAHLALLSLSALEWARTGFELVARRLEEGRSPVAGGAIIAAVTLATLLAACLLTRPRVKTFFRACRPERS